MHGSDPGQVREHGERVEIRTRRRARAKAAGERIACRVLVVSADPAWCARVRAGAQQAGMRCDCESNTDVALRALSDALAGGQSGPDLLVVDQATGAARVSDMLLTAERAGIAAVVSGERPMVEDAVEAMRLGALDCLRHDADRDEVAARLTSAAERSRSSRDRDERVRRLRRVCRRLNSARREVVQQVDSLCADLVSAYEELAEHMNQVTTASEFNTLVRQELDIESLLRTTLEFVLARSGPTNAAVFLPTTSGDYSLGAYVNYDCPKDTADILLDHLANAVAPRFEDQTAILHLAGREEVRRHLADDADWMLNSHVLAFACHHEGECLAIFLIFRDEKTPFQQPLVQALSTISALFARQLARVIQIHHRHLPKDKWGLPGTCDEDRDDLAA